MLIQNILFTSQPYWDQLWPAAPVPVITTVAHSTENLKSLQVGWSWATSGTKVKAEGMNFTSVLAGNKCTSKAIGIMHCAPCMTHYLIIARLHFKSPSVHSSFKLWLDSQSGLQLSCTWDNEGIDYSWEPTSKKWGHMSWPDTDHHNKLGLV